MSSIYYAVSTQAKLGRERFLEISVVHSVLGSHGTTRVHFPNKWRKFVTSKDHVQAMMLNNGLRLS